MGTNIIHGHPLVEMARREPNERRRRFLVALAAIVPHLNADEIDGIEAIMRTACGRVTFAQMKSDLDAETARRTIEKTKLKVVA
jgi:hypothetical protein